MVQDGLLCGKIPGADGGGDRRREELLLDSTKVRRARERIGASIETAAERAGVAKGSFLRAEHGEDIRPVTARRVAEGLGVRVADLVLDEVEAETSPTAEIPNSLEELLALAG